MTYRDPNEPLGGDAPTEAYRAPDPAGTDGTPPPSNPWLTPASTAVEPPVTPAASPAPTTPAVPPPAPRSGGSRVRWAAALVVVALVVVASGVAAVLLTGRAPDAKVLGWVPDDAVVYGEFRLDLPGDQKANLGEFLSKFPGFRDQASLDIKIDDAYDRFISAMSDGAQTYTGDIKPWFGGEIALSMERLPAGANLEDPSRADLPQAAFYLSITDETKARAWFEKVTGDLPSTSEDHGGTQVTIVETPNRTDGEGAMAYAFPGSGLAIVGHEDGVKAALDTKGAGGLAEQEDFVAARATSDEDQVGFMYLDMGTYMAWVQELQGEMPAGECGASFANDMADMVPAWVAFGFRIEGDALVMDGAIPAVEDPPYEQENRAYEVTRHLPSSTIAVFGAHDVGASVMSSIDTYRADPACAEAFRQIDGVVGLLGGFDGIFGWMQDVSIVLNRTDDGIEGGLVVQASDAEEASDLLATLRSFVSLGGAQAGISSREVTHGDTTIVVVDLGSAADFWAGFSMGAGMDVAPPDGGDGRAEIAWAQRDDLVVMGVGTDFVTHVLDTDEGSSLAADDRFSGLLGRAGGAEGTGLSFLDLAAVRELVEGAIRTDADAFAKYEKEVQPFLVPFDAWVVTSSVGDDRSDTNAVITIK